VTVCVLQLSEAQLAAGANNIVEVNSGWHGQVGLNHLNGMQALAFVRQRYGLPQGDIDRIARQQHFLGALFRQAASSETIANPGRLTALLDATTSALTLDEDTSLADLRLLAVRMQGVSDGGVRLETVATVSENRGGQSAQVHNPAELDALVAEMTGRTPSAGAAVPDLTATVPVAAAGLLGAGPGAVAGATTAAQAPTSEGGPNPASCVY
nr:LCP family protein [Micromonospora sp. DSM 115978]